MKHTKGPWIARPDVLDFKTNAIDIVSKQVTNLGDQISVATVFGSTVYDEDQKIANAQLIAAAPEMLEALENLIAAVDRPEAYQFVDNRCLIAVQNIRKIIKKARGEE